MNRFHLLPFISLFLLLFGSCGNGDSNSDRNQSEQDQQTSKLNFTRQVAFLSSTSNTDTVVTIEVAIAQTKMEKNQGLMDVKDLPSDKGMLFIFNNEKRRSFWMANTPLSLDIIFVNAEKKIIRIHHRAQPYSQKQYKSSGPAKYVIETIGGFSINHDIREGMAVSF